MKKTLQLLILLGAYQFSYNSVYAQENNAIQTWQLKHPEILLISQENYNNLDKDVRTKIADKVIVFQGEITYDKLLIALQEKAYGQDPNPDSQLDTSEKQFIKDWLGQHQGIKVITHDNYINLTDHRQQQCQDEHYLILIGEDITKEDCLAYPF